MFSAMTNIDNRPVKRSELCLCRLENIGNRLIFSEKGSLLASYDRTKKTTNPPVTNTRFRIISKMAAIVHGVSLNARHFGTK